MKQLDKVDENKNKLLPLSKVQAEEAFD